MGKMNLKSYILEGGNALKHTSPILQDNVIKTVTSFYKNVLSKLGLSLENIAIIGSAGKKHPEEYSGDIDIAVSVDVLRTENIHEIESKIKNLTSLPYIQTRDMSGIGVLSVKWPIKNQKTEYVQIDIMPVKSIEWATWAYFSPHYMESSFKGLFRNEIMFALAKYTNIQITRRDENGIPLEWNRLFFDLSKGLLTGTQSRIGKTCQLKNPFTKNKTLITNDPNEVVKILLGFQYKKEDAMTWEDVFGIITNPDFQNKENLEDIFRMTANGILNKGQDLPPELEEVLNNY